VRTKEGECEDRKTNKMQQLHVLLLTFVSKCFRHHYAHLQENKGTVTAFDVLFWFCWMWLAAVVGALSCRM
jgi:hypothetical protein